jgi:hypothetical protein
MAQKIYATPRVVASENECTFQEPVMTHLPKDLWFHKRCGYLPDFVVAHCGAFRSVIHCNDFELYFTLALKLRMIKLGGFPDRREGHIAIDFIGSGINRPLSISREGYVGSGKPSTSGLGPALSRR